MANLKNINFMSGTRFTNLETTSEDELYAVNIENDATFKSFVSGMGMPSARYVDLTLGASGSTYTAPANGYFYLTNTNSDKNPMSIINATYSWGVSIATGTSGYQPRIYLPAKKGDTVLINYNKPSGSQSVLWFFYAEGENN